MSALLAVSDLHVRCPENRAVLDTLRPGTPGDWLLVAGDVAEVFDDIARALTLLSERFERVIWAPGNHELWTTRDDPEQARGAARYDKLVEMCRSIGVLTPEDPYPVWQGSGGPVTVAPLFLLYDYSFLAPGVAGKQESLERAYDAGVVCTDEFLLHPDPYPSREEWCWDRVTQTERRLAQTDPAAPLVMVNHFPLNREPTRILRFPLFAQWCGTERTAAWHKRFPTAAVVYGHLHIPRTTWLAGVRFEEVSLGYPREWKIRGGTPSPMRTILS